MKITPCRSKVYDTDLPDVVRITLLSGQEIEVPFENHKNWEVSYDPDLDRRSLIIQEI